MSVGSASPRAGRASSKHLRQTRQHQHLDCAIAANEIEDFFQLRNKRPSESVLILPVGHYKRVYAIAFVQQRHSALWITDTNLTHTGSQGSTPSVLNLVIALITLVSFKASSVVC